MILITPLPMPRFVTVSPLTPGPRLLVTAPPLEITFTLSAFSFRRNDTTPAAFVMSQAYGVANVGVAIASRRVAAIDETIVLCTLLVFMVRFGFRFYIIGGVFSLSRSREVGFRGS